MSLTAQVSKGSFKCVEDANGKYIEATAASSQLSFPQPHAYGTFEFSFVSTVVQSTGFSFINSDKCIISNLRPGFIGYGYNLLPGWDWSQKAYFQKFNGSSYTNFFNFGILNNMWYDARITRDETGKFTVYIRSKLDARYPVWTIVGVVTDTTYTTSNFAVWDTDTSYKLCNFKHRQGVEA